MTPETLLYITALAKLLVLISVATASIICVASGLWIFISVAKYILKAGLPVNEKAEIEASGERLHISLKGATGLILIVVGLIAGIILVRSELNFGLEVKAGGYGIGSISIPLISTAKAAATATNEEVADFCRFTLGRTLEAITIRGADGDTLSLERRRLLTYLNKVANDGVSSLQGTPQMTFSKTLFSDEEIVRHLRYVLVQSALPKKEVKSFCEKIQSGSSSNLEPMNSDIQSLLSEGVN